MNSPDDPSKSSMPSYYDQDKSSNEHRPFSTYYASSSDSTTHYAAPPHINTSPSTVTYGDSYGSSDVQQTSPTSADSPPNPLAHGSVSVPGSTSALSEDRESEKEKKRRSSKGKERMRIELAPDQPPTTQGKERERVYVACLYCRSRKIRCDGAKPVCFNCRNRAGAGSAGSAGGTSIECLYDAAPKRRGPDRCPGARHRVQRQGSGQSRPRTRTRAGNSSGSQDGVGSSPRRSNATAERNGDRDPRISGDEEPYERETKRRRKRNDDPGIAGPSTNANASFPVLSQSDAGLTILGLDPNRGRATSSISDTTGSEDAIDTYDTSQQPTRDRQSVLTLPSLPSLPSVDVSGGLLTTSLPSLQATSDMRSYVASPIASASPGASRVHIQDGSDRIELYSVENSDPHLRSQSHHPGRHAGIQHIPPLADVRPYAAVSAHHPPLPSLSHYPLEHHVQGSYVERERDPYPHGYNRRPNLRLPSLPSDVISPLRPDSSSSMLVSPSVPRVPRLDEFAWVPNHSVNHSPISSHSPAGLIHSHNPALASPVSPYVESRSYDERGYYQQYDVRPGSQGHSQQYHSVQDDGLGQQQLGTRSGFSNGVYDHAQAPQPQQQPAYGTYSYETVSNQVLHVPPPQVPEHNNVPLENPSVHPQWAPAPPMSNGSGTEIYADSGEENSEQGGGVVTVFTASIERAPSMDFVRKTWWDALLDLYGSAPFPTHSLSQPSPLSKTPHALTHEQDSQLIAGAMPTSGPPIQTRGQISRLVMTDLQTFFRVSNFWLSFINLPLFYANLCDAHIREAELQPALLLAILAMGTLMRSSEKGLGAHGRARAAWIRDQAQAALEGSICAGWVDPGLAQAAWLIVLFEISAHPQNSRARTSSAFATLDSIIRTLRLTQLDSEDPRASTFAPHTVPRVPPSRRSPTSTPYAHLHHATVTEQHAHGTAHPESTINTNDGCPCEMMTLGQAWPQAREHVPFWLYSPAWNPSWSVPEIRMEECRRLCWTTLTLMAGYTSYAAALNLQICDLYVVQASNYRLLFPGESLYPLYAPEAIDASKESVWALCARTMLLWNSCVRMRSEAATDEDRARFTKEVWQEADTIEAALDAHTCASEKALLFQGREYLFNCRMFISYEFRRFIPCPYSDVGGQFHHQKAEEFLKHQMGIAKRMALGIRNASMQTEGVMSRRPFLAYWFMGQVSRTLQLYAVDQTLKVAIEVAKELLPPIDFLSALWPCEEQRKRYARLRHNLDTACHNAGIPPPPPPNFNLPFVTHS